MQFNLTTGPRLYKMFFRQPAILVFPFVCLTWYMIVQAWPEDAFAGSPEALVVEGSTKLEVSSSVAIPIPITKEKPNDQYAYVFYATSDSYACSALVNFHRLRTVLHSRIPAIILVSAAVSNNTISVMRGNGLEVIRDEPPPIVKGGAEYYSGVLLKLRGLRLHQIKPNLKRVQILDSDQLIMKNIDSLFELPVVDVAAPLAYWIDPTAVTTTLLIANLSEDLWTIVNNGIANIRFNEYDMDLINRILAKRLMILPGRYCTLNSHWEALDTPGWFGSNNRTAANATSEDLVKLYDEVEVLHFTAQGKPWAINVNQIDLYTPGTHPIFKEQFELWREIANGVCRFDYPHYNNRRRRR